MVPRLLMLLVLLYAVSAYAAETAVTNSVGMRLVRIEAGAFRMGQEGPQSDYFLSKRPAKFDDADWDERPVHAVTLTQPFMMGATEVTNAQFERFDPARKAARLKAKISRGADEPVVNVSWDEAVKFCAWLSEKEGKPYRLPTEAEWEYACRASTTTLFNTGDCLPDGSQKWIEAGRRALYFPDGKLPVEFIAKPGAFPLKVAQTLPNGWGLYDMHGNAEEWCLDWYGPYEAGAQSDPAGRATGDFRVTRGGGHSQLTRLLRSANRGGRTPETRTNDLGFRVVQAGLPAGAALPAPEPPLNKRDVSQAPAKVTPIDPKTPVFRGPIPFVKIPKNSLGPLFSRHNHSPAIAECANGDLLAIWFSCVEEPGSELGVAASRLRFGKAEWESASPFWDAPDVNDHFPKLWSDGGGLLFFFTRGAACNIVMTSDDNGATWSRPRPIEPPGEFGNLPFRTREGFIVIPHDTAAGLVMSRDHGETWTYTPGKGRPADCFPGQSGPRCAGIHNAMTQLADGSLLAYGRINEDEVQKQFEGRLSLTTTTDWGKTWHYGISPFPVVSTGQRPVMVRLKEGPLLFCSFTDQGREWNKRKGLAFKDAEGKEMQGYGLYLALSEDDGKMWPMRKLITPGGPERKVVGIDNGEFTLSDTMAERGGYLSVCQTRDGMIQLISSRNHYAFNLAWARQLPQ